MGDNQRARPFFTGDYLFFSCVTTALLAHDLFEILAETKYFDLLYILKSGFSNKRDKCSSLAELLILLKVVE